MTLQFATITGFFGQLKDRFKFYHETKILEEKLSLISQVEGNQGVELIYPYDFKDKYQTKTQLEKNRLIGAAVNVDIKGEMVWNQRSLTALSAETRKKAFDYIAQGAEMSRFLGANLVTVCPLQDGYDYHFEVNYERSWQYLIDGLKEVAQSYPDVKISIEYKFQEPLSHYLVGTAFNALYVCLKANVPNLGVTLDFGHALQAGENPAETMTILARENKQFHVHINDNDGKWDWDLISGSRNLMSYLEFLYIMKKIDYRGWIALDVTPRHRNPIEIFSTSIYITKKLAKLAERLDEFPLQESMEKDSPQLIIRKIYDELIK
jgi:xylose isomerase